MTDIDSKEITRVKGPSTPDAGDTKDATEVDRPALVALETAEVAPPADLEATVIDKNKRSKNVAFGAVTLPPIVVEVAAERAKEAGLFTGAPKPPAGDDANVSGTRLKPATAPTDQHDTLEMPTVPRETNESRTAVAPRAESHVPEASEPPSAPTLALSTMETATVRVPRKARSSRAVWVVAGVLAGLSCLLVLLFFARSSTEPSAKVVSDTTSNAPTSGAPALPTSKPAKAPAAMTSEPAPTPSPEPPPPVTAAPTALPTKSTSAPSPSKAPAPKKPAASAATAGTAKKPAPPSTAAPKSTSAPNEFSPGPRF